MKNELQEAWEERVAADNAAITEITDKFYGSNTELSEEERVALSLRERAKIHGCHVAATWEYDFSMYVGAIQEHTGMSRTEALLFLIFKELKQLPHQ